MTKFNRIKNLLSGSSTMPSTILQSGHVHNDDGSCCGHDHSHNQSQEHHHEDHVHDATHEHIHKDGTCCDHDHSKD